MGTRDDPWGVAEGIAVAGLFDIDLIPKIQSLDRKVRLSGIDKRREKAAEHGRKDRSKRLTSPQPGEENSERQGTIDITV